MTIDISVLLLCGVGAPLVGYAGGLLAGLAGVGGGLLYTPFFVLSLPYFLPEAHASAGPAVWASLWAVCFTGVGAAWAHWRRGHVDSSCARVLLPGLVLGAWLGLYSSFRWPTAWVLWLLAVLDAWIAFDLCRARSRPAATRALWAAPGIGYLSGALGIAGGTLLMPLLRRALPLSRAVGTASFCGLLMVVMSVWVGGFMHLARLPSLAGAWPLLVACWLSIALAAAHGSQVAAGMHARLPPDTLRRLLSAVFVFLALGVCLLARMVGG